MIVLDACAVLAMVTGSKEGVGLRELILNGEKITAPDLFKYELLNVLRKYVKGGYVSKDIALMWYNAAVCLVDEFCPIADMGPEILTETLTLDHPSYDISYLVLTRRTGSTLFTLDKRLVEACVARGVNCVEVADL